MSAEKYVALPRVLGLIYGYRTQILLHITIYKKCALNLKMAILHVLLIRKNVSFAIDSL